MNILIPSYLKVFRKLPRANLPLWTNNLSTNSLQLAIFFKTLWKLYIVVVFLYCCNDSGVVGDGKCTSSTLWFTRVFPCSFRIHFNFPSQREFGLIQCASAYPSACIWVHGRIIWSYLYCYHQIRHQFTTLLLHFIMI